MLERVKTIGDPWEAFVAYAVPLHTKRKAPAAPKPNPPGDKHKSPEQLAEYAAKRDFSITNEPVPMVQGGDGDAYVVHRHHASRVHYDLRLEEDGVLRSWVVPRGLPPRPGIKRLAVQTEPHPMEYLHFNGVIPDGEYGAGPMWIFSIGRYEITKVKKTGFYFRLASHNLNAEYRIHQTRDKEWLLERVDSPQVHWLDEPPPVMLATAAKDVPVGPEWIYEVKWDGIRALIQMEEGQIRIFTRSGREVTSQFPELLVAESAFRAGSGIFDGEIVCLDEAGRPDFRTLIKRFHSTGERNIERLSKRYPVYCYLFDAPYLDGRQITEEPLHLRYDWLKSALREGTPYRLSEQVEEGVELFEAAKTVGLEGIMAKQRDSKYRPGKRSPDWLKIKVRETVDCEIIGFTKGKGDRQPYFGALHIAERVGETLVYRGRVGTGFDDSLIKEIHVLLQERLSDQKPLDQKVEEEKVTTWVKHF